MTQRPASEVADAVASRLGSIYMRVSRPSPEAVLAEGVRNRSYLARAAVSVNRVDGAWIVSADYVDRLKFPWLAFAVAVTLWQLLEGHFFWFYLMLFSTALGPTIYARWRREKLSIALSEARSELETARPPH